MCWYVWCVAVGIRRNHLVGHITQITRYACMHVHNVCKYIYKQAFKLHPAMQIEFTNAQTIKGEFTTLKSYYASMLMVLLQECISCMKV